MLAHAGYSLLWRAVKTSCAPRRPNNPARKVTRAAAVKAALHRTTLDNRLATWVAGDDRAGKIDIESWVSRGVYYLLMLFVLVAVFQTLGLTMLTEPLRELLAQLFAYAPRLLGASALLLVAWLVASGLRLVLTRLLRASKF